MPQATEELREEWHSDGNALDFLYERGFVLLKSWEWVKPEGHELTEKEQRAVLYLIEEWDYGGIIGMYK